MTVLAIVDKVMDKLSSDSGTRKLIESQQNPNPGMEMFVLLWDRGTLLGSM